MAYDFDRFLTGSENMAAFCAAGRLAAGETAGPLYVYGPSGSGKTHLLRSVAGALKDRNPEADIRYLVCDDFTAELLWHISRRQTGQFRENYLQADALLLDDLQFLAGKEATQRELADLLRKRIALGKAVVLAADRKAEDLEILQQELLALCREAQTHTLHTPGAELRQRIIRLKSDEMGMALPDAVCALLAEHAQNARQAEGLCRRMLALRDLEGMPLEPENVREALSRIG